MAGRIVGIVAALLLAAVGTLALVGFVRGAESRALAGEETVEVLVVKDQVDRNTPAEDITAMVTTERVPAKVRAADSVGDLDQLEGQVTAVDLVPGEQLVRTRFVLPAQLVEQSGVEVPDGLQEVTVALDPQRAVGGQVRPGDVVGVLASFVWEDDPKHTTKMNHQQVLVTNVQVDQAAAPGGMGSSDEDDEGRSGPAAAPTGSLLITLAVDTAQAETIVFAAEHGTVWLSAQNESTEAGGSAVRHDGNVYDD